jgi:ABC-type transport system involved in multi-copper enzyme maturation permease subunit
MRVDGDVTFPRVVASEWSKLWTLRSTPLVIVAAMLAMVAFGAIIGHNTRHPAGLGPEDLVASRPLQGYYLGQLLIGSLGALVVSGEYSSGMIRATFAAVPRRLPVLLAKLFVFTVIVASAMVVASIAAFFVAQAFLSGYRPTYALSDPDVLRVVIGTGVYLSLIGLLGGAIAWIVRSTPGALGMLCALSLVLPVLLLLFHGAWAQHASLAAHRGRRRLLHEPAHAG